MSDQAFPSVSGVMVDNMAKFDTVPGMTLRDYFAAKVIASLVANICEESEGVHEYSVESAASDAYTIADAMIAARS